MGHLSGLEAWALVGLAIIGAGALGMWLVGACKRSPRREPETWDAEGVEEFLRVGTFSLDDWLALPPETRSQIAQVARMVERDRIVALAAATQSEDALAALSAPLDGGQSAEDHIMGRTLGMMVQRAREEALRDAQRGGSR